LILVDLDPEGVFIFPFPDEGRELLSVNLLEGSGVLFSPRRGQEERKGFSQNSRRTLDQEVMTPANIVALFDVLVLCRADNANGSNELLEAKRGEDVEDCLKQMSKCETKKRGGTTKILEFAPCPCSIRGEKGRARR